MANLLLETTPETLCVSDVQALRAMVDLHGIDPALLDDALNRSRLTIGREATDSATPSLANEACLTQWFLLQIGTIAEVIWDGTPQQALRQAPPKRPATGWRSLVRIQTLLTNLFFIALGI
jgi:hypothetical protein